jgi:aldehyde dehydrogenase (NAD+)
VTAVREVGIARPVDASMYVDGKWVAARDRSVFEVVDPYRQDVVAHVPEGTESDVEHAVSAARRAFEGPWSGFDPRERRALLHRAATELANRQDELEIEETRCLGVPIRVSSSFLVGAAGLFAESFAELAGVDLTEGLPVQSAPIPSVSMVVREPVGVVASLTPWNFPLLSAVFKVFPALAAGNTVVLKPSPLAPLAAIRVAEAFEAVGLPPGVLNVVTSSSSEVASCLTGSQEVDLVSFTGSSAVGRLVAAQAANTFKRVLLELGGKSPVIVLDDADLDCAVDGCLFGAYFNAGQFCESGTRLFVPRSLCGEFTDRLVARAATIRLGDPLDWETDMGPLITSAQHARVCSYIEAGLTEGANLVLGGPGNVPAGSTFVQPTIFTNVSSEMRIAREEIFGPVLAVLPYDNLEDAVRFANDTIYGLAATVWSDDIGQALQVARRLRAGTVWINDHHQVSPANPFGGYKQSGIGRELGLEGLKAYTEVKSIYVDLARKREKKFYSLLLSTEPE